MNDLTNDVSVQGSVTGSVPSSSPQPASVESQSSNTRLFTQDEVNKIVGSAKESARRKGYEEATKTTDYAPPSNYAPQAQQPLTQAPVAVDENAIAEKVFGRLQEIQAQQAQTTQVQQTVNQILAKEERDKGQFENYGIVRQVLNPEIVPDLYMMANGVDNTPAVLYELATNPTELAQISALRSVSPVQAFNAIQKLSSSIKERQKNADAVANANVPEPLTSIKPSTTGTGGQANDVSWVGKKFRF